MMKKRHSFAIALTSISGRISLVAVIFLLIGSIVVVLNYMHQMPTQAGPAPVGNPTLISLPPTPTPTPEQAGTTFYTTPGNFKGLSDIAWSPDSKRVATSDYQTVRIWDALDGQHQVVVQMPIEGDWASGGIDWSPNSQQLAIATSHTIAIVDGQSGKLIRSHTGHQTAMVPSTHSSTSYLTSQFPDGSGAGYSAIAWSPDGTLLATALSYGPTGDVQVLNPKTDTIVFTIQDGDSYNVGSLSWSSDGKYIAAIEWDSRPNIAESQTNGRIVVWQVSTHQIVFQHEDYLNSGFPVVWQPQSHLLAFSSIVVNNGPATDEIEIWDVIEGKQVKQYDIGTDSGPAWSPDGKYLAYGGYDKRDQVDEIIIINATTDKQVYVYKGQHALVGLIAWSPNGRYIASSEEKTDENMVVKVWSVGSLASD